MPALVCVVLAMLVAQKLTVFAGGAAYLPAIGPAPLRFAINKLEKPESAAADTATANPVVPAPHALATQPTSATPPVTIPDLLRSLVLSPLWSALCDGLLQNPKPAAEDGSVTAQNPSPASPPVVTAEMLAEFFRASEPPAAAITNSAVAPASLNPPPVFILPASSATYRVQ